MAQKSKARGSINPKTVLVVLLVILIGLVGWVYYDNHKTKKIPAAFQTPTGAPKLPPQLTPGSPTSVTGP